MTDLKRTIQEGVPAKQITMLHLISSPDPILYQKVLIDPRQALGIITMSPWEGAIIAADLADKAAPVEIKLVDRFKGVVFIQGDRDSIYTALDQVRQTFVNSYGYTVPSVTES